MSALSPHHMTIKPSQLLGALNLIDAQQFELESVLDLMVDSTSLRATIEALANLCTAYGDVTRDEQQELSDAWHLAAVRLRELATMTAAVATVSA